jgi:integrase/recombinase XerD
MYIPDLVKKECLRRGLSPRTIKTYNHCIERFFRICKKDPKEVGKADLRLFLDYLVKHNRAGGTINVYLNALKFFYQDILGKKLLVNVRYSKIPKRLPTVLTKEEIIQLIGVVKNPKHSLMVKLMYSAGLRLSELLHLKVEHFDFSTNHGWVRQGKGNKDRIFIIAKNVKEELLEFIQNNDLKYKDLIFQSYDGSKMSSMSVQKLVKKAAKKTGIKKRVHPHALRHSFATHIMEHGNDLVSLQSLLGHKSPETTMVYVHTASPSMINVKSPYDSLA